VVNEEVSQVVVVGLGLEKGPTILDRPFQDDPRDRDELEEPVAVFESSRFLTGCFGPC